MINKINKNLKIVYLVVALLLSSFMLTGCNKEPNSEIKDLVDSYSEKYNHFTIKDYNIYSDYIVTYEGYYIDGKYYEIAASYDSFSGYKVEIETSFGKTYYLSEKYDTNEGQTLEKGWTYLDSYGYEESGEVLDDSEEVTLSDSELGRYIATINYTYGNDDEIEKTEKDGEITYIVNGELNKEGIGTKKITDIFEEKKITSTRIRIQKTSSEESTIFEDTMVYEIIMDKVDNEYIDTLLKNLKSCNGVTRKGVKDKLNYFFESTQLQPISK